MTIEKLAYLLVAEYFDGSPGSEQAQIAVEQEIRNLKQTRHRIGDALFVVVEVEG